MMKFLQKTALYAAFCCFYSIPVFADVEVLGAPAAGEQTTLEKAKTVLEQAGALNEAATEAAQTTTAAMNQANGLVEQAMDPEALIKTAAAAAVSAAGTAVMGAMKDMVDGKSSDDEVMEKVQETYQVVENTPMPEQRRQYDEINKKAGKDIALLFARARMLRKELKEEEPQDLEGLDEKTIAELQQLSKTLMIKSGERWNKILEMQAYIMEFNSANEIQKFKREAEEKSDDQEQK